MSDASNLLPASAGGFRRNFATVCAGYLCGHGILRLFAAILVGLNDRPRAELLERWFPAWNSLACFIAAWGVYQLIVTGWFQSKAMAKSESSVADDSLEVREAVLATLKTERPMIEDDWKAKIKAAQKRKDVTAILRIRKSVELSSDRAKVVDRRLGKWFTKHFQRMMLTGRAAEAASDVEIVAEHYIGSEEFAYFHEILPVVRQCAALKTSVEEDE